MSSLLEFAPWLICARARAYRSALQSYRASRPPPPPATQDRLVEADSAETDWIETDWVESDSVVPDQTAAPDPPAKAAMNPPHPQPAVEFALVPPALERSLDRSFPCSVSQSGLPHSRSPWQQERKSGPQRLALQNSLPDYQGLRFLQRTGGC